eukprot:COSAG01_NODE_401_length_17529_cov_47.865806_13_plen_219_part_00
MLTLRDTATLIEWPSDFPACGHWQPHTHAPSSKRRGDAAAAAACDSIFAAASLPAASWLAARSAAAAAAARLLQPHGAPCARRAGAGVAGGRGRPLNHHYCTHCSLLRACSRPWHRPPAGGEAWLHLPRTVPMKGFPPQFVSLPDYIIKITKEIWEDRGLATLHQYCECFNTTQRRPPVFVVGQYTHTLTEDFTHTRQRFPATRGQHTPSTLLCALCL